MEIICLMGKPCTQIYKLADQLELRGYSRLVPYTTKKSLVIKGSKTTRYKFVTHKNALELEKNKLVAVWKQYSHDLIGIPHPFGHQRYVLIATPDVVRKLKKIYQGQVWQVFIDNQIQSTGLYVNAQSSEAKVMNLFKTNNYIAQPLLLSDSNTDEARKLADITIQDSQDYFRQVVKLLLQLEEIKNHKS